MAPAVDDCPTLSGREGINLFDQGFLERLGARATFRARTFSKRAACGAGARNRIARPNPRSLVLTLCVGLCELAHSLLEPQKFVAHPEPLKSFRHFWRDGRRSR